MSESPARIAILGASGLIGQALTSHLMQEGHQVLPIARRFSAAQKASFGGSAIECPVVGLGSQRLASLLFEQGADIVVNCIGVLRDDNRGRPEIVHQEFVSNLVEALASRAVPCLLIHVSIPGLEKEDRTSFSLTKRRAESTITSGPVPFIILRPGFVVAPAAFGGSALIRALAMLPASLPAREAGAPFAPLEISDIARTVTVVAHRWRAGERDWNVTWELMDQSHANVDDVITAFRDHLGGPAARLRMPSWLLDAGAAMGDFAAHFGWSPPIGTMALGEMRRGVAGDPGPWIEATGIEPVPLHAMLQRTPATIQEKWFARLYLIKAVSIAVLVLFWVVSGLIALTVAFDAATAILTSHGFPDRLAWAITVVSSLADIAVGLAIAFKKTCRAGLLAGIGVSLFYLGSAAMLMPDMWIEPLGALIKTLPAIILMLVILATLENR